MQHITNYETKNYWLGSIIFNENIILRDFSKPEKNPLVWTVDLKWWHGCKSYQTPRCSDHLLCTDSSDLRRAPAGWLTMLVTLGETLGLKALLHEKTTPTRATLHSSSLVIEDDTTEHYN